MEILGMRMRSGEDVIFKAGDRDEEGIVLNRPLVPIVRPEVDANGQQLPNGREMLHFIRWMPFAAGEDFKVNHEDYVGETYKVPGEIEKGYLEVTSSIQIVQPGQLNG